MVLDRLIRDREAAGDAMVAEPFRQQVHDLALARRQPGEPLFQVRVHRPRGAHPASRPATRVSRRHLAPPLARRLPTDLQDRPFGPHAHRSQGPRKGGTGLSNDLPCAGRRRPRKFGPTGSGPSPCCSGSSPRVSPYGGCCPWPVSSISWRRRRRSTSTVVRTVVVLRREAPVPADYLFAFTEPVGNAPIWPAATG